MPWVLFPPQLAREFPDLTDAHYPGASLAEVFARVGEEHPGVRELFLEENGSLRSCWMVMVGGALAQDRAQLSDAVEDADDVYILGRSAADHQAEGGDVRDT